MLQTTPPDVGAFFTDRALGSETPSAVFRPIQYLGSKLRSIEPLLLHTSHLFSHGDLVVDCFSGSSVVSQAFANAGARVVAVDSQQFCQHIASAMLGVSRQVAERCAEVASVLTQKFSLLEMPGELGVLLDAEDCMLSSGPSHELVEFYQSLPQVWNSSEKRDWFTSANAHQSQSDFGFSSIIASHYSGTYFGLRQALFFDYIRSQIHSLREKNAIGEWTGNALLTALYSAMSTSVCSAGKHFAQPLAAKDTGNAKFRIARLYADRSINCMQVFRDAALQVDESSQSGQVEHSAWATPIASVHSTLGEMKPRLIYADPPYTAQQYSRFYHVLEIAAINKAPELQMIKGKVTSGLYNVGRYKSPFSSKTDAPEAFRGLVETAKKAGASFALSYSASSENSNGNSRMIGLPALSEICEYYFGKRVRIVELSHAYRPFNSESNNNTNRNDPEILIVCEA